MAALDLLGGALDAEPQAILIRVKNPGQLAAKAKGAAGAVAAAVLPGLVQDQVLGTIADKLRPSLTEQGVDAEVVVVNDPTGKGTEAENTSFFAGMALGAGLLWAVGKGWRMLAARRTV